MIIIKPITQFATPMNGRGIHKGVVTRERLPVSCRVAAYDQDTFALSSTATSLADTGEFLLFVPNKYFVVAVDPGQIFNAVTQVSVPPITTLPTPTAVNAVFKPPNQLEVNWTVVGYSAGQYYYRSETPMETSAMPEPMAVLNAGVRKYIDNQVAQGKKYYIRIATVNGTESEISDEVSVDVPIIDSPRNIAIVTENVTNTSPLALKSTLEEFGHTVTILLGKSTNIETLRMYDLLIGSRTEPGESASTVALNAFNEGIPILCSNHAGTGIVDQTWPTKLRLLSQLGTSSNNDNVMYRFSDYDNILASAGITLPNSDLPYTTGTFSTYSSGTVAPGANVLAYRSISNTSPSMVVAERGSLNLDGDAFPARIVYIGAMFNYHTDITKKTINEAVKWLTRPV